MDFLKFWHTFSEPYNTIHIKLYVKFCYVYAILQLLNTLYK